MCLALLDGLGSATPEHRTGLKRQKRFTARSLRLVGLLGGVEALPDVLWLLQEIILGHGKERKTADGLKEDKHG